MADTVIRSFLVGLGFKIDEPGLRRFNEQIVKTHHAVRDFSLAFAGFAIGIEEAIRRTARQFENLFYLSQQTGISVKNLQTLGFAFGQIGLSADQMKQTVASFTSALLDSQGLRAFVNQYVPGFRNAEDALKGFAAQYKAIIDQYGVMSAKGDQFRDVLRAAHLDPDLVLQYARGLEDATKWEQRLAEALYKLGLNSDEIAEKAKDAMNEWRFTWELLGKSIDRIIGDTFPAFRRLLEDFNTWLLKGETVQSFNDIADSIHNWLQDEKNIKAVEDDLIAVGQAAAYIAKGILELIKGFVWLSDNVGPIQAILITFFGYVVAKAALAQGAILAMNAAIWGTGASLRGVAAIAAGLGGIAAFIWGMSPSTANAGEDEAIKKGLRPPSSQAEADRQRQQQLDRPKERTFWDMWTDWVHKNFPKSPTGGPDTVEGGKPPIPGARKSSFGDSEGGPASITEALFNMFGAWFKGDTAFRPIVVLADEYYTKLVDALRNMTGITSGGGIGPGGTGAGGTNTPGKGRGFSTSGGMGGPINMSGTGTGHVASKEERIAYYRQKAKELGLNPDAVIATVANEGLNTYVGDSGKSFGDFQLFTGGGMGNQAEQAGINIRDPNTWKQQADFAMGEMAKHKGDAAWFGSQWHGPRNFAPWAVQNFGDPTAVPPVGIGRQGSGEGKISGLNQEFREKLDKAMAAATKATGDWLDVVSGYRDPEHQRRLFEASDKSGHMVARPGHSFHEKGLAADLGEGGALARHKDRPALKWLHEHAEEFGLQFPMDWEPWHIEPMGSRGGRGRGGDQMSRTNNIDSEHNVTINVHGSSDPQGTARSVADLQDRRSMIHSRNLRTSIA
jgi:hypothetical protein